MTTGIPLSPGTMFLLPRDLYHSTEAPKRGYALALCFPSLCWGAHRSDPQPGASSPGRHRSEGSRDFWDVILQHLLSEGQGNWNGGPHSSGHLPWDHSWPSEYPACRPSLFLLGWKELFYCEITTVEVGGGNPSFLTEDHRKNCLSPPLHAFISAWCLSPHVWACLFH